MVWELLFAYTVLELFEIQWQKAHSMRGILEKLYTVYAKSSLLFFIMHPTFIVALGLGVLYHFTMPSVILLALKAVDIITKLVLMQKLFVNKELSMQTEAMLNIPIKGFMPYLNLLVYTPLVYFVLTETSTF